MAPSLIIFSCGIRPSSPTASQTIWYRNICLFRCRKTQRAFPLSNGWGLLPCSGILFHCSLCMHIFSSDRTTWARIACDCLCLLCWANRSPRDRFAAVFGARIVPRVSFTTISGDLAQHRKPLRHMFMCRADRCSREIYNVAT